MIEELIAVPEAAARLHMHERTLRRLVRNHKITVVRSGRWVFFTEYAINEYIASNTHVATPAGGRRRR